MITNERHHYCKFIKVYTLSISKITFRDLCFDLYSWFDRSYLDEIWKLVHMHSDHVGGIINNENRVFPDAIVYAEKKEADYWLDKEKMNAAPDNLKTLFQVAISSVDPYIKANKFKTLMENWN